MRREPRARKALGAWPLDAAAGADSTRPERIPDRPTRGHTLPPILRTRPPLAFGTVDFRLIQDSPQPSVGSGHEALALFRPPLAPGHGPGILCNHVTFHPTWLALLHALFFKRR